MMLRRLAAVGLAVGGLLLGSACSEGDEDGSAGEDLVAAPGEVPYALADADGWETVEHLDPPSRPDGTDPAPLGAIDWYAAYELARPVGDRIQVDRVQVQGFETEARALAELLIGARFERGAAADRDALLGAPAAPTEPAIILFPVGEAATVVVTSYELALDELVAWCDDLRFVSDEEWAAVPSRP
jgi:hypothetical protein